MQGTFQGPEWSPEQAVRLQDEVMGTPLLRLGPAQMVIGPVGALLMTPSNGLFGLGLLLGSLIALWASASDVRLYAALGIGGLIIWGLIHSATAPIQCGEPRANAHLHRRDIG